MAELGYVEGKNIVYDMQKTNFEPDKEQQILKKFVADKVDLILVFSTEVSIAAKAATQGTNIPVLFTSANIEGMGLVNSVREPGGNITGVRFPSPDFAAKRFEILHELAPQVKRVLIPYQKGYPSVPPQLEAIRPAATAAGITLVEAPANSPAELETYLQNRAQAADVGFDAILMLAEPLTGSPDAITVMGKFAAAHKMLMGGNAIAVGEYASIFGVSTDNVAVGKLAAPLADKIFKGIAAGTIPVLSAESYMQINYKAAQQLGLTIPEGLLKQANEIIR
jgi:putative ABC transport system substrate-binding protein